MHRWILCSALGGDHLLFVTLYLRLESWKALLVMREGMGGAVKRGTRRRRFLWILGGVISDSQENSDGLGLLLVVSQESPPHSLVDALPYLHSRGNEKGGFGGEKGEAHISIIGDITEKETDLARGAKSG